MGENAVALLFVDAAAFRIGLRELSALAERFDAQIRVEIAVSSALAKNKHQAVWWKPYRFVFRGCSSFPDRFARLELSALAERFDAQIRVEKTPCGSRAVCVGKK